MVAHDFRCGVEMKEMVEPEVVLAKDVFERMNNWVTDSEQALRAVAVQGVPLPQGHQRPPSLPSESSISTESSP
ncbi:hypothetical protein PM082_005030 [Marasmius tenuissimus]|nr:hypothetical protein PM082_005030 [Marasmius tenuissimus]